MRSRSLFPCDTRDVGHHHHHGGGHHHHPHFRLGGGPGGQQLPLTVLAPALAVVLFAYGAVDGFATYRVYVHGQHGMGVVTRVFDGTTILEVEGHVCAINGEYGHVGGMLPVAYPPGRQINCIIRQPSTFRWPLGAILAGSALIAGFVFWRRGGSGASPPAT